MNKRLVFGVSLALHIGYRVDRGHDVAERIGEAPDLGEVASSLDGAAFRMAKHHDKLCAGKLGGELEAADEIGICEIAGDSGAEDVADPLIEHEFRGDSGVDTAEDGREWILAGRGGSNLGHEVPLQQFPVYKPVVALHKERQRLIRRQSAPRLF